MARHICHRFPLQLAALIFLQFFSELHGFEERVVSDPNIIHSSFGVPLHSHFNESAVFSNENITSAAGCPSPIEDLPWLYFGNPPKCFLVGTTGPCASGQIFFGNLSSSYGFCECVCNEKLQNQTGNFDHLLKIKEGDRFLFCQLKGGLHKINEAAYDKENGLCHFLETQAICAAGEWMVKDETGHGATCIPECSSTYGVLSTHSFDYHTRKCIEKPDGLDFIQPISLATSIGQRECEEGKVYSKTLNRCIAKSKAFFMRIN
ncbi:unnamed protein product [Orchesella dallaii]|uniref:DUF4789 domain-containing protein n=1 Tax=Orchesella dallaii TaxID=48710 RepID=A0ABP1Q8I3_9HEXA